MHGGALTAHIEILTARYPEDIVFSLCVDLNSFGIIKTHASGEADELAALRPQTLMTSFFGLLHFYVSQTFTLCRIWLRSHCAEAGNIGGFIWLFSVRSYFTDPLTPEHMHVHKPVHTCSHISPHTSSPARLEPALNADPLDCSDWLTFKLCNKSYRAFLFLCPQ